jgi:hypothetical protein
MPATLVLTSLTIAACSSDATTRDPGPPLVLSVKPTDLEARQGARVQATGSACAGAVVHCADFAEIQSVCYRWELQPTATGTCVVEVITPVGTALRREVTVRDTGASLEADLVDRYLESPRFRTATEECLSKTARLCKKAATCSTKATTTYGSAAVLFESTTRCVEEYGRVCAGTLDLRECLSNIDASECGQEPGSPTRGLLAPPSCFPLY